jgi:hypothetical protein
MSTSLAAAGGWERDFVTTVEKNISVVELTMTPAERKRAKEIMTEFKKTYRLPREFNSLD